MWRRLSCSAFLVALAACGGDSGVTGPGGSEPESPAGPESPAITSLVVTPDSKTLLIGESLKLSIIAKDQFGLPCLCTPTFVSSDAAVAAVTAAGEVIGKAEGSAIIKVTCTGGITVQVKITVVAKVVVPVTLTILPELKQLKIGESVQLSLIAKDLNGQACDCKPSYSSSDPEIATVSSTGLVTAKAAGEVWVTVLCVGGVSAKAKIIVSATLSLPTTLVVLPGLKELKIGESVQLSLIAKDIAGLPCDCKPSYSSADVKIAVVSSTGLVTAKAVGEVWITVTCVGGVSAKVKIIVKAVAHTVSLDPVLDPLKIGATLQLKLVAKDINGVPCDCAPVYSSADPTIAAVSKDGVVTAKAAGEVWITVLCVGGVSAKVKIVVKAVVASVTLTPVSATLKIGSSLQLAVIAKDINGLPVDCVCTYESLNPLLAKVTDSGLVTGLLDGLVEIKATCEGVSAKTNLALVL